MRHPRSDRFGKLLISFLGLMFLLGAKCSDDNPSGLAESFTARISLENADGALATHLFLPGESFPCCQVPPGGGRTTPMPLIQLQGYTFQAGRNETILDSVTCFVERNAKVSDSFGVRWTPGAGPGFPGLGPDLACSGTGWEVRR
jgi:hypothetical protein